MMGFLHIGQNVMVNDRRIIGIFDLDITSQSPQTRRFLDQAEQEGVVLPVCDDIPKSFLVCDHPYHRQIVYISQLNTQTLVKRAEKKKRIPCHCREIGRHRVPGNDRKDPRKGKMTQ